MRHPNTLLISAVAALSLGFVPPAWFPAGPGQVAAAAPGEPAGLLHSDPDTRTKYAALGDSGYVLLDAGKTAEAITVFTEMEKLIPGGPWGNYNIACAHGRAGDSERALAALQRALQAGFDNLRSLQSDPDLAAVLLRPEGASLLRQAAENHDRRLAHLSGGLPAVPPFPVPEDSLDHFVSRGLREIYEEANTWHHWQVRGAVVDFRARQLESVRAIKKDDPAFDYALGRVRILTSAVPIGERWGPLADGVRKEAEAYLAGKPTPAGRAEVSLDLAVAAFCRERPEPSSPAWSSAASEARRWLAQIDSSSAQAGGAAAWRLALDLMEAGADRSPLYPRVREFAIRHWADPSAKAVASTLFIKDLIGAYWPIPLNVADLDGQPVSFDQYRGKVLLIDFWATWCAPCRKELPGLRRAYAAYHDRGLEVLSISFDFPKATSPEKYRAWITENEMTWRHIYDQKGFTSAIGRAFFIYAIPTAVLVGRDGTILALTDELRGKRLKPTIEKAL